MLRLYGVCREAALPSSHPGVPIAGRLCTRWGGSPLKRSLVEKSEDWKWSSFRHYTTAEIGPVEIESQWTADRRNGRAPKLLRIRAV